MSDFATFLVENRHIFSVCPECDGLARLSELGLERKGAYSADWLDKVEKDLAKIEEKRFALEQKQKELRERARALVEREVLPKRLAKIAPAFSRHGIDPRDVSALFDPVPFVVFKGMTSGEELEGVVFFSFGELTGPAQRLAEAVRSRSYSWNLIRVGEDGSLDQSRALAADRRVRTLPEFSSGGD